MKKILLLAALFFLNFVWAQKPADKKEGKIRDRYQSTQPQDLNVPPPPTTIFPAQFPTGNKKFIKEVEDNLNREVFKGSDQNLSTQIILKIDATGKILNISLYGSDQIFNDQVKESVKKTTENIKWEPAKNKEGKNVIDIVRIPFRLKSTSIKSK